MKKFKLFSFALAALMLGACSSEDVLDTGGQESVLPGEKGYVSLSINLPTQPSTRANDNFDDGESYEYKVNDATLLIFAGANEADAKFSGAYDLKTNFEDETSSDQITTNSKIIQEIERPSNTGNVYALVVLNKAGFLSKESNKWYYGADSEKQELNTNVTFSNFAYTAKTFNVGTIADPSGNFLMFNAPLYDKQGSLTDPAGGKVTTLAVIDKSKIYPTATQAQNNPATSIYVERAVAKVTVKAAAGYNEGTYNAELQGWILDVTNKKSFPVRNMGSSPSWWSYFNNKATVDKYRFVGGNYVELDADATTKHYRTYFGIDPNYDGTDGTAYVDGNNDVLSSYTGFNTNYYTAPTTTVSRMGSDAYCLENTFNVDNMRKDQTTRVVVAAKLEIPGAESDGSFLVLNNDKTTFYTKDNVVKLIKNAYIKSSFVQNIINDPTTGLDVGSNFDENDIEVKFKKVNSEPKEDIGGLDGGTIIVAEVYTKASAAEDFKGDVLPEGLKTNNTTVTEDINNTYAISFYKSGIAYYPVQIKHFGDDQTPWNGIEEGYGESYPGEDSVRDNNWLGRYGVLRNNWYEIEVSSVKNIGYAEVEPETGYDDPVDAWISVEINVLSWAKRTQSVDL